jgi:hypothetical protein
MCTFPGSHRSLQIVTCVLFSVGLTACDDIFEALLDAEGLYAEPTGACGDHGPLLPPSCEDDPGLCGQPNLLLFAGAAPQFHIAFVPDGYEEANLASFLRRARALTDELLADVRGVVGRRPDLFRFSVVMAPSQSGDVVNGSRSDTLLGGCLEADAFSLGEPMLRVDDERAAFVVDQSVDDVDVVVAILRTGHGRPNVSLRGITFFHDATLPDRLWPFANDYQETHIEDLGKAIVKLNAFSDAPTLDHELAHALIGLADEYSEVDACFVPTYAISSLPGGLAHQANLSLDPSGAKWAGIALGSEEGGNRFSSCVHHPPGPCRMHDTTSEGYCAVCEHTINKTYRALDGKQDGSPLCALSSTVASMDPTNDFAVLHLDVIDGNAPSRAFLIIDDLVVYGVTKHSPGVVGGNYSLSPERLRAGDVEARLFCEDAMGGIAEATLTIPRHEHLEP